MSAPRFRSITVIRALEVLEILNNAPFRMLLERLGCGQIVDGLAKDERTTPKLKMHLAGYVRRNPSACDLEGAPLADSIVREAAKLVTQPSAFPWGAPFVLPPVMQELADSLAVDGWTITDGVLTPTTPIGVQPIVSILRKLLSRPEFEDASRRLTQLEAALDAGHWEQANASMRPFLSDVFIGIAQAIEGNGSVRRDEADARKHLESVGFFKLSRKVGSKSEEGEFIQKMFPMLGSEGSHSGRSDQAAAVYRYGLIVQTAYYFLARWERGPEPPVSIG